MNIFVTSACPKESAMVLDDKRVVKMVLESAQLLSNALNYYGVVGPYKTTHVNHPVSKWTRKSRSNYEWLLFHFNALLQEYTKRYHKTHKCQSLLAGFLHSMDCIPEGDRTDFENCTTFKNLPALKAYKECLKDKWRKDKRQPTWYRSTNNPNPWEE